MPAEELVAKAQMNDVRWNATIRCPAGHGRSFVPESDQGPPISSLEYKDLRGICTRLRSYKDAGQRWSDADKQELYAGNC